MTENTDTSFYLSEEEKQEFVTNGYLGPIRLLSESTCESLVEEVRETITADSDPIFLGEMKSAYEKAGLWTINYFGLDRHVVNTRLRDILKRPEITHRLSSLLGPDLICWRSQFFEKRPGDTGTYWHQGYRFRENGNYEKLTPPPGRDLSLIQLTVWIALTDTTVSNGCLRFLRNSQNCNDMIDWEKKIYRDGGKCLLPFISQASPEARRRLQEVIAASDPFGKAKWVFENVICKQDPEFFERYHAQDMEMKAGEFIIFTSMLIHGSHPNTTDDDTRLAFSGRYTTNDVKVFDGLTHDLPATVMGKRVPCSLENTGCLQVHGEDRFHYNKMLEG